MMVLVIIVLGGWGVEAQSCSLINILQSYYTLRATDWHINLTQFRRSLAHRTRSE